MGVSSNTELNDQYKRERDSTEKFARYLPYAVNYCAKDNNIVSEECKTYYNSKSKMCTTPHSHNT
jgi:hypothetical protein